MPRLQRCALAVAFLLFASTGAQAAPPLTTVQDVLFNADGTRFNGIAVISWSTFEASDGSEIPAHTLTTQIVNGLLRVQLVPTTNALTPASYSVLYNSTGSTQFNETWAIPPSNATVRVRDIRIGAAGSIIGTGGGTAGGVTSVNITDVIGLSNALNLRPAIGTAYTPSRVAIIDATGALDGASGSASDCLHVDGSSAPCGSGTSSNGPGLVFVDGEIPSGTIDGTNSVFLLGNPPSPPSSLEVYRNGLLLNPATDYSVTLNKLSFATSAIPQPNDIVLVSYRMGANNSGLTFVDNESPAGNIDGSNTVFTLSAAPNPVSSLAVYRNGLHLRANLDYTVSGAMVIFQPGLAPQPTDVLLCTYRH